MTASVSPTGLDLDRPLALHPLTFLDEGDEVTVGRPDVESYCILPADGAAVLHRLVGGETPRTAAHWYHETYGEPVDIVEFLEALDELNFLADPNAVPVAAAPVAVRWGRLGAALFSPPAWACYAAIVVATVVVVVRHPSLAPHYRNLFFSPYMSVLEVMLFIGQIPLLLLHELFHVLAGRRLGVRSRLAIGRRLYYVVFVTSLDGLLTVPRRKRYLPILAGVICDVVVLCLLTLAAAAQQDPDGSLNAAGQICLAMAYVTLLRIIWQGYFYLRTDLYQLIVTVLGCVDLHRTARRVWHNRINRILRRDPVVDESTLHPVDRRAARWYSWLLLVGYVFSLTTLVVALLPSMVRALGRVFGRLVGSGTDGTAGLIDSTVFLALNLVQITVLATVAIRDRRRARSAGAPVHLAE